jgi:hypothetical protein
LLMNADISISDLMNIYKVLNNASRQRIDELLDLTGAALGEAAVRGTVSKKAGTSGPVRRAKNAEMIKDDESTNASLLKDLLKKTIDENRDSEQTSDKPAAGRLRLPPAAAVLEGTAAVIYSQ